MAGVVKPYAASPFAATAINPPLPPSDAMSQAPRRAPLAAIVRRADPLCNLVSGYGANEKLAGTCRGDRCRSIVRICACADQW
jgi:hypothetical protein